jgi:hypothetical protein
VDQQSLRLLCECYPAISALSHSHNLHQLLCLTVIYCLYTRHLLALSWLA